MKAIILALVLALCGDLILNDHRISAELLGQFASLMRGTADAFSGSFFAA